MKTKSKKIEKFAGHTFYGFGLIHKRAGILRLVKLKRSNIVEHKLFNEKIVRVEIKVIK